MSLVSGVPKHILDYAFSMSANCPEAWLEEGQKLKLAGDLIYDAYTRDLKKMSEEDYWSPELRHLHISSCAMLLYGLSIENLAKGLIIKRIKAETGDPFPALEKDKKTGEDRLKKDIEGHDAIRLLGVAGVALTPEEESLLKDLSAYVNWAGRYPIPKKRGDMSMPLPNERATYLSLFARLEAMY